MENLRKFNELMTIDRRNSFWIITNPLTKQKTTITLEDWYKQVESISLCDKVPQEIRSEFNVARNLAVYSWFCHSFHRVCKTKAFGILEEALAVKYNQKNHKKTELQVLLEMAVEDGSLDKNSDVLAKEIPKLLNKFRKDIAQNEIYYKNSLFTLKICSEMINQVFEKIE